MPRLTSTDTRWLELHGQKWRVTVAVPRDLRRTLGTRLKQNLHTDSLAVANRLKLQAVAEIQARIADARESRTGKPRAIIREAIEIAAYAERAVGPYERAEVEACIRSRAEDILGPEVSFRVVEQEDGEQALPVFDAARETLAREFMEIASGAALPLAYLHEQYLAKSKVKPRTRADDVRALKYLAAWCERERVPATVQAITRKVAVRFSDGLGELCGGLAERTQNKYLGRLSRYWSYLVKREKADINPFAGLLLEVPVTKHNEEERAFTEDEIRRLLVGGAEPRLADLMLIAALTGARLDAIVDLKVKDALDGAFTFKPQKKERSARDIPIHSALRAIVERRTVGRLPDEPFFPDWPPPAKAGSMRERSFKASNRFTAYRRQIGVDQVVAGKRRSLTNFHSFRRWFCTKAERAGQSADLIAAIVGHKRSGMTLGRYSEGPEWKKARRCIEAVKLPALSGETTPESRSLTPRRRSSDPGPVLTAHRPSGHGREGDGSARA